MTTTIETTAVHTQRAVVSHSGGPGAAFVRFLKRIPAWLTIDFLITSAWSGIKGNHSGRVFLVSSGLQRARS